MKEREREIGEKEEREGDKRERERLVRNSSIPIMHAYAAAPVLT
jgi:hypothetical protein